jgi:NAD(P)-dependent dehydrogenase (short-subunit alcohol dehydrogenase family)
VREFAGKIAIVTGAGSGMGRELARQLSAEGCHVALCDIAEASATETRDLCLKDAPTGTRITAHRCDVSSEAELLVFRDEVIRDHDATSINLLFNNAGVGGGGSFLNDPREAWERTFNICWYGVYYGTRVFMPLLVAADEAHLINTSSVNGFWASIGPATPHTSYSAAKFAVKGFSEALITELRLVAPHVKVSVVMPGHIGTGIALNSFLVHGEEISPEVTERAAAFRNNAPTTSAEAATVILDGVRADRWRILVGDDAHALDDMVRAAPEEAYELSFLQRLLEANVFGGLQAVVDPEI